MAPLWDGRDVDDREKHITLPGCVAHTEAIVDSVEGEAS